jgi:hypothetical protein
VFGESCCVRGTASGAGNGKARRSSDEARHEFGERRRKFNCLPADGGRRLVQFCCHAGSEWRPFA